MASNQAGKPSIVKFFTVPPWFSTSTANVMVAFSFFSFVTDFSLHFSWLRSMYALHVTGLSIKLPFKSLTSFTVKLTVVFSIASGVSIRLITNASLFTTNVNGMDVSGAFLQTGGTSLVATAFSSVTKVESVTRSSPL